MIAHFNLQNFTAFEELEIPFSSRINVIVGSNGTGKTLFLKAIYGLAMSPKTHESKKQSKKAAETELSDKFLRLFLPDEQKIGTLHPGKAYVD